MIDPQSLELSALYSLPLLDKERLPSITAVYFCLSPNNEVLYIGQTINLVNRWTQHHRYQHLKEIDGVRIAWLEVPAEMLLSIEESLIDRFKPLLNTGDFPCVTEAQRRAFKKYYEANKHKWDNHTESAKEARRKYDAKRGSRAEAMRKSRAKKKAERTA
jgi:hypothetical protein